MSFAEELFAAIGETGKSMMAIARELGIPYRTMQDWKAGRRTPPRYQQSAILEAIKDILDNKQPGRTGQKEKNMIRYRLVHSLAQFPVSASRPEYKIVEGYVAGDATASDFDEIICWKDTLDAALSALIQKSTDIYRCGNTLYIDEYGVETVTVDEDGDETEWEYIASSKLPEYVRCAWSYRLVGGRYEQFDKEEA